MTTNNDTRGETVSGDDELLAVAMECGLGWAADLGGMREFLSAFAAKIRESEREACAKMLDARADAHLESFRAGLESEPSLSFRDNEAHNCAQAIRARSKP